MMSNQRNYSIFRFNRKWSINIMQNHNKVGNFWAFFSSLRDEWTPLQQPSLFGVQTTSMLWSQLGLQTTLYPCLYTNQVKGFKKQEWKNQKIKKPKFQKSSKKKPLSSFSRRFNSILTGSEPWSKVMNSLSASKLGLIGLRRDKPLLPPPPSRWDANEGDMYPPLSSIFFFPI